MKTYNKRTKAFGFINMLVTVAVIAIIGSIAYVAMTGIKDSAEEQLLNDQVATLNKSVKLYLNTGGSIDGLTTAQAVIDKMKTMAANGEKMAGFRGTFIDPRLDAVEQTDEEAGTSGELRVIWDPAAQDFKIATGGQKGIKEFKIDPTVTPESIQVEERATMFELAATSSQGSWVWDFDTESTVSVSPLMTTASHDTNLDIDPSDTNYAKSQLAQPTISPAPTGTAIPLTEFGTEGKAIAVTDPNSAEHSQLFVSVNGSYWDPVASGSTVNVPPGGNLATFANVKESSEHLYYSSYVRAGRFEATQNPLPAPAITTSGPKFNPIDEETITVSVTADIPREGDHWRGSLNVKIGDAGSWTPYTAPFTLDIDTYSQGVTIYAKTSPTQWGNYYTEAEGVPKPLGADVLDLAAPAIQMASTSFHPIDRQSLTFTLLDENVATAASMQKLVYSLDAGDTWEDYEGEVSLGLMDHLVPTTILAKSVATQHVANLNESALADQALTIEDAVLSTPQIASQYPVLNPQGYPSSTITLTNPNLGGLSNLEYSTDGGATWTVYDAPFDVTFAAFPEGATIVAKAVPIALPDHLTESALATKTLPIPPKLITPQFDLDPGNYVKSVLSSGVTLDDDNTPGDAHLVYRVNGGSWVAYDPAGSVEMGSWPGPTADGAPTAPKLVEVKALATDYLNHRDSDVDSSRYARMWLTPNLAFDVSSSGIPSSIHEFTGSSTGLFTNAILESDNAYVLTDGSTFTWGTGTSSWLNYDGTSWEGMQAGEMFRLGTLDYFNGTINSDSGAAGVTLELTVALELPDTTEIFDVAMNLDNTTNTSDVNASADFVTIGNLVNDFTTQIDGIDYSLNLAFGYYGTNGFNTVDQFHVHEGAVATADLWGFFTSDEF